MAFRHSLLSALVALLLASFASAERMLQSSSLNTCMDNSRFSATFFRFLYTPNNSSFYCEIVGISDISSNVVLEFKVFAYGYEAVTKQIDPSSNPELAGLDPMNPGRMDLRFNTPLPTEFNAEVPGVAYTVPDLDGKVQIYINDSSTGKPLACVETELSNGHTVYQKPVGWVTAVIAGLGLATSAIASGLGHSNTAAHLAANAMSLFGFFQAQAFAGMMAVHLPPVVSAWTQNFQWSMGIIRVGFIQRMATWYQRATGGTPDELLSRLSVTSVRVQKRAVQFGTELVRRTNSEASNAENRDVVVVAGIERVGFKARIESSNIFMTGYIFFIIFIILMVLGVAAFKFACDALAKAGRMRSNKFQDFRNGWTVVLRGIMFRIALIGFPQMVVLCFWEMTQKDSSAELVLAIFTIFTLIPLLCFAVFKVWKIADSSKKMHQSPIVSLYSNPESLNKWGFLYVQFKVSTYYFIGCTLAYILTKGMVIAFAQSAPKAQAIIMLIVEGAYLVLVSVMRPFMDKTTNVFNIAIAVVNFLNAVFLLVFSGIFNGPEIVSSVMGVVFFFYNVIFAFVLLLVVLAASLTGVFSKNPDTRYQPMRDDRGSYIKNALSPSTELKDLGMGAHSGPTRVAFDKAYEDETGSGDMHMLHAGGGSTYALNSPGPKSASPLPFANPNDPFSQNEKIDDKDWGSHDYHQYNNRRD